MKYKTQYKIQNSGKPLCIVFDRVDGYIKKCDRTIKLFRSGEKHLIMLKSNISDVQSRKYTKIEINADDDLLLVKSNKHG